jgi:ATP-binding cassette subfamily B protein
MAYHMRLLAPIQNLMGLYTGFISGGVSLGRLFELFDTPAEISEQPGCEPLAHARGEIAFENVRFRYADAPVLEGVSFRIEPGSFCAIVGPSGSGKSTLVDLLVRFYDPEEGAVLLDGHNLRALRLVDLRREIVLVDQSSFLFQASVRENIAYGRPEASEAEIEQAARAAAIHDRILAMPGGYAAEISERGTTLSAGERHRITLARALLRNPSVLVLDEPTAALDAETEREIARMLRSALAGRTAILITHRESLAAAADQVVLLDAGRAVTAAGCP